ncbi:Acyl-coenzyme A dehydrogenase [wastewater metagenome]|uniref:Acyl-coenzyme A dehydrogenase n=2 Tax=unclassified sequences TaxID=12908 RepID=A0A5B8R9K0_9ZZZZ|nr:MULTISPECIES: acyl-CoA dehydrogenase [Arhodomonas]QEA04673.1 acyl-coenzyme A dehydrogenase [uncultured organism]
MYALIAILAAVAAILVVCYRGIGLRGATAVAALYLAGLWITGGIGVIAAIVLAVLGAVPAVVLNSPSLRRRVITRHLFPVFQRVLPGMSRTEQEALEAGDTWWETDLFRGNPDWRRLHGMQVTSLTDAEQAFLDGPVATLCGMLDEDDIVRREHDLPEAAWRYIRDEGFFGMIIPEAYGGLAFSSLAQSTIVSRIASRSLSAAVTVMVPNSLGPGELLMKYGTDDQKSYWLPRLADGREIPCFALTGPDVGSDAGGMPDYGIVCRGEHEGEEVLGVRVSFSKRYITLAPVATVVGLAFRLYDPEHLVGDEEDVGITCALVPAGHPGVRIGDRHFPMGLAFMNGPVEGEDVFIPLEWIIGGREMAGAGWRMLVECLSVGRAISLPALGASASQMAYRTTGAYARIRRQFNLSVGQFEGVQEAMARIGGGTYTLEAARRLTASAGDMGVKPSVVSAIAKYHMTEWMRRIIDDAMDIHGGRGIIYGPRNYLGYAYQATPVAITVEGANILTRSMMIFGQGAIRCHPYVLEEMTAAQNDDLTSFDRALFGHIGYSLSRGTRALLLGLTGARLARAPEGGPLAGRYRALTRMSSALAFVSDVAMGVLGGELKRRESLSARLGDVLSQLYLASAVLKFHRDGGSDPDELDHVCWAVDHALAEMTRAFDEFLANFPNRGIARVLRWVVFPLGRPYRAPADALGRAVAERMMAPGGVRDRITNLVYIGGPNDAVGRVEHTFGLLQEAEPHYVRFRKAVARGEVGGHTFDEQIANAVEAGVLDTDTAALVSDYERARADTVRTDAFPAEALTPRSVLEARAGHGRDVA